MKALMLTLYFSSSSLVHQGTVNLCTHGSNVAALNLALIIADLADNIQFAHQKAISAHSLSTQDDTLIILSRSCGCFLMLDYTSYHFIGPALLSYK